MGGLKQAGRKGETRRQSAHQRLLPRWRKSVSRHCFKETVSFRPRHWPGPNDAERGRERNLACGVVLTAVAGTTQICWRRLFQGTTQPRWVQIAIDAGSCRSPSGPPQEKIGADHLSAPENQGCGSPSLVGGEPTAGCDRVAEFNPWRLMPHPPRRVVGGDEKGATDRAQHEGKRR